MGVNSGKAWVGCTKMKSLIGERWTYTASGLVTVLAARIGALSGESRFYVGLDTYQLLENSCDCEFMGQREVKNIRDPISIYWVKNIKDNHSLND